MRKYITVLLCIGVLISWQIWQGDVVSAGQKGETKKGDGLNCDLAGTWRTPGNGIATFIPLDPAGRRFSMLSDYPLPEDPTFDVPWSPFTEATAITPFRGVAVKVSQNLYKWTGIQIGVDKDGNKLYEFALSGETKFITDCDHRVSHFYYIFYNGEGEEISGNCVYGINYNERFKIVPPCDELPPFPEISD